MLEKNMKNLFKQEKYNEVIKLIKEEYVVLFRKMLDFKNEEYDMSEDFEELSSKIPFCYPQYSDKITRLENTLMDPEDTYFDVMNNMLNIYNSMKNGYKEESDYSEDMWDFGIDEEE